MDRQLKLDKPRRYLSLMIFTYILFFLIAFFFYARMYENLMKMKSYISDITIKQRLTQVNLFNLLSETDFQLELINYNKNSQLYFQKLEELNDFVNNTGGIFRFGKMPIAVRLDRGISFLREEEEMLSTRMSSFNKETLAEQRGIRIRTEIMNDVESYTALQDSLYNSAINELMNIIRSWESGFLRIYLIILFVILISIGSAILILYSYINRFGMKSEIAMRQLLEALRDRRYASLLNEREAKNLSLTVNMLDQHRRTLRRQIINELTHLEHIHSHCENMMALILYTRNQTHDILSRIGEENNDPSELQSLPYDELIVKLHEQDKILLEVLHRLDEQKNSANAILRNREECDL